MCFKRSALLAWVLLMSWSLAGCVTSRAPLYDRDKDRVFDAKLLGTWRGASI